MTAFDAGAIVLVRFPFTDLSSSKKRPALVVSPVSYMQRHGDAVVLALTSQDQNDPSLALSQWQSVGLPKMTWIKPVIGTLSAALIDRQIGQLDPRDRRSVDSAIKILLASDWK
jgi:mRNA interferase MazF